MTAPAWAPAAPVLVITGHYGVGKTNLALNLALDAAARGLEVTVVDLDVVNPFFRSSDYRALLAVRTIAPVFADPWTGRVLRGRRLLIVDAGGRGAPRRSGSVGAGLSRVLNRSRNLTQAGRGGRGAARDRGEVAPRPAAVTTNTHLQGDTDEAVVAAGIPFAQEVARLAGPSLAFTTVPAETACQTDRQFPALGGTEGRGRPILRVYVRTPGNKTSGGLGGAECSTRRGRRIMARISVDDSFCKG